MKGKMYGILIIVLGICLLSLGVALADTEPNDSFDEAESVGEGTFSGNVAYGLLVEDIDYYKISVPAYKSVFISGESGADASISMTLYDWNRESKDYASMNNGERSTLFFDGKSSSAYTVYLKINGDGEYTFTVEFRPSDMMSAAVSINSGQSVEGTLKAYSEVHWYKIDVPEGKILNVTITSNGGEIDAKLYDDEGNIVDWEIGNSVTLTTKTLGQTGTLYIKVTSSEWQNREITYTLTPELTAGSSTVDETTTAIGTMCIIGLIIIIVIVILIIVLIVKLLKPKKQETPPQTPPPQTPQ